MEANDVEVFSVLCVYLGMVMWQLMTRSVLCSLWLAGQGDVPASDWKCSLFSVLNWTKVMWMLMT